MLRLGLTGGIGSGKSAVAKLLAVRGAAVVDADEIAREVAAPGGPAYAPLVARFGKRVLAPDGTIDRPALAAAAFGNPQELAALNAITHPLIGLEMARRLDELEAEELEELTGLARGVRVGVVVIPLLRQEHVESLRLGAVVVVDCPVEIAVERLVRLRGMEETDAHARVDAQIGRMERVTLADYVIDNSGSVEHLAREVDALWAWVEGRSEAAR